MAISSITTNLIKNKGIDFVSQLANNSDSIAPMLVKDTLSNGAIVYTYSKEGGKDDAREKAIEEFGTGAVWLLMIPFVKKFIDKTVYPALKLNPSLDVGAIIDQKDVLEQTKKNNKIKKSNPIVKFISKCFDDGIDKQNTKNIQDNFLRNSSNAALQDEKVIFNTLNDKNEVVKNFLKKFNISEKFAPTNAQLYKRLQIGKFFVATGLSALALIKIIQFKQKTTEDRIARDVKNKNSASKVLINKDVNNSSLYQNFSGKIKEKNTSNSPSFTGLEAFMTNPILNTSILDGVITSTRLVEARKGEKKEVALKEAFQLVFIYGLAKPIQAVFEKIGERIKKPIGLDPKVLFDDNLKEKVQEATNTIKQIQNSNKNPIEELFKLDANSPLIELLEKNGVLKTAQNGNSKAISHLIPIKDSQLKKSFSDIESLSKNLDNLGSIKGYKVFSVFGNVAIAAIVMGVVQPKIVIALRKLLNNGDNRNPAIAQREKEMQQKHCNGLA